jgi:hypothetical protein
MRLVPLILAIVLSSLPVAAQHTNVASPGTEHGVEGALLKDTNLLDGKLYHVQGIALDRDSIWVTSVDALNRKGYLHQFNRVTMKLERQHEVTDGPRFHPRGFSIQKDSIWIPVAEYTPHSSTVLEELDKKTLTVKRKIPVADSLGCVAVMNDRLVAGNWDTRQFYIFNKDGKQLRIVDNPQETKYQDLKFASGTLVASGVFTHKSGAIDWLEWPSLKLIRRLKAGTDDHGVLFTREAMAIEGNNLYLLPEDGPSRLFHFVLSKHSDSWGSF